jgi:hypothetical protein
MNILAIVAALASYFSLPDALAFTAPISSPDLIAFVAVVGTVISQEPLIYRDGIPSLLRETLGIRLGKSTIAKLFSPAIGQGVEPACYWNRRPLYRPADVLAWAKSRLRPGPGMTAMSAEEIRTDIPASEHTSRTNQQVTT